MARKKKKKGNLSSLLSTLARCSHFSLPSGTFEKKGKRERKKSSSPLAGNNQEISKHSRFAIGLNEGTALLIFFPLSFSLPSYPSVSVSACYNYSLNVLCQNYLLANLLASYFFFSSQVACSSDLWICATSLPTPLSYLPLAYRPSDWLSGGLYLASSLRSQAVLSLVTYVLLSTFFSS
ncbi:hypothetical protein HOY80DRAFT_594823 [Tuber brumale]|nr:hypothetical protein HOY80DRAFT_594823 [Tuber brumale]